ncbi:MAG: hypothetical protein LUB61_07355, partial [Eggerthellaceae bacterium]|nr:hypothetical protein [Eggerthellaceae bacterium]
IEGLGRDFGLAGGIGPDNVCEALSCCSPVLVDASSSMEMDQDKDAAQRDAAAGCPAKPRKDPQKVADFVGAVRAFIKH